MVTLRTHRLAAVALAMFAGAAVASAANTLQLDINALTSTAAPGFGTGYTGAVNLSTNANTALAGILINGTGQTVTGTLNGFTGTINLVNGGVTGGSLNVSVLESDAVTVNTYSATIVGGTGSVNTQAMQGFTIDGLTFMGNFSSSTFAGVDVSSWFNTQPLPGSFLELAFSPNAQGVDSDADVDIFVEVIPLPAGGALGFVGLTGLACVRRRRA